MSTKTQTDNFPKKEVVLLIQNEDAIKSIAENIFQESTTFVDDVIDYYYITVLPKKMVFMDQIKIFERATKTELNRVSDNHGNAFLRFIQYKVPKPTN